jgi:hypothetical protein
MPARQLIGGASFSPDALHALFGAFDDAWAEIEPDVNGRPEAIECARTTLANIVLALARTGPVDRDRIKAAAIDSFRKMYRIPSPP